MDLKVRENRLRRQLNRMGYILQKNRVRDQRAYNYGGYMIYDLWTNELVCGQDAGDFTMSINDVEEFTKYAEPNKPKKIESLRKKDDANKIFQVKEVTPDDKDFEDPELKEIINEIKEMSKLD